MTGWVEGRPLAVKIRATARGFSASPPRPYTVSVGNATSPPLFSTSTARSISSGVTSGCAVIPGLSYEARALAAPSRCGDRRGGGQLRTDRLRRFQCFVDGPAETGDMAHLAAL